MSVDLKQKPIAASYNGGVSDTVNELAGKLRGLATYENGVITYPKDVYYQVLPEGLDKKTVDQVMSNKQDVVAAQMLVNAEFD